MCIKADLIRMESERTIGSTIEWSNFKKLILSLKREVESLRAKACHDKRKIKSLENQLNNYKRLNDD